MYWNILKKDLKRKKTMNFILILFIILSSTFIASSINNIVTISTAVEDFMEMSGMSDYIIMTKAQGNQRYDISDKIEKLDNVDTYKKENVLTSNLEFENGDMVSKFSGMPILSSIDQAGIKYYTEDNEELKVINSGEVYVHHRLLDETNLTLGDNLTLTIEDSTFVFKIAGIYKEALFGSPLMGNMRILLNDQDFNKIYNLDVSTPYTGNIYYLKSNNVEKLAQEITDSIDNILVSLSRNMLKYVYILDMVVAATLLVFSIFIILISFINLKFTISFTIEEDFREIGVMKAIGIRNNKIRSIYMIKYCLLAFTGSVFGFFLSFPIGELLLKGTSKNIVIVQNENILINILSTIFVMMLILVFSAGCTAKIKRLSPLDAIRDGDNGERYHKKNILSLQKIKLNNYIFMAINDICSNTKRYISMIVVFTLTLLCIGVLANTTNTIRSEKYMIESIGFQANDFFVNFKDNDYSKYFVSGGIEKLETDMKQIENELKENGIPGKVSLETDMYLSLRKGEKKCKSISLYGVGTKVENYTYLEGSAPIDKEEIAISHVIADKLDAKVGDKIIIEGIDGNKQYLVTAIFQSMINMGEGIRFHEDVRPNFEQLAGVFRFQINFKDKLNSEKQEEYKEKLLEIYPDSDILNGEEYANLMTGGTADILGSVKWLVIGITVVIGILMVVLMEYSFILKEKNEIALLKAIGFQNHTIEKWHLFRIIIVMFFAVCNSAILSMPALKLLSEPVFKIMGAKRVDFQIHPFEIYVIYPVFMLIIILIATWITTKQMKKIKTNDISNIE